MSNHLGNNPAISIEEARRILGITSKGLSDEAVERLVAQVAVLTDIVLAHIGDSKIKGPIDISNNKLHTG